IALILQGEPDWSRLPAKTPERLKALLGRCLEKDSKRRLRDMGDARIELEEIAGLSPASRAIHAAGNGGAGPAGAATMRARWTLPASAAALLVAGASLGIGGYRLGGFGRPAPQPMRFEVGPPAGMQLSAEPNDVAISPDGRQLAFVATDSSGASMLWLRPLDSFDAHPLPGTGNAAMPFWSPDGREIGYFADHAMLRIPASGGTPQTVCDAPDPRSGAWGPRGVILLTQGAGPVLAVRASGGTPAPVTAPQPGETSHRGACFLPDGEHFTYVAVPGNDGHYPCFLGSIRDRRRSPQLMTVDGAPRYTAPGYLVFTRAGAIEAQRFDPGRARLVGDPFAIGREPATGNMTATAGLSVSRTGALAWLAAPRAANRLVWLDRAGHETGTVPLAPGPWMLALLPNSGDQGTLYVQDHGRYQNWTVDLERGVADLVTDDASYASPLVASFDGRSYAYGSARSGRMEIYVRAARGAPAEHTIPSSHRLFEGPTSWSPDGRWLLVQHVGQGTGLDIAAVPVGGGAERPWAVGRGTQEYGFVSPDGHWALYVSDETETPQVYVESFPDPGRRLQVSEHGGVGGYWTSGGTEIIVQRPDLLLESVPVTLGHDVVLGAPRPLFRLPKDFISLDVSRDGRRFLVVGPAESNGRAISIATDWASRKPSPAHD
ncbi:MAG TPA: hypothetical protein VFK69_13115, partial [Candidatus Eisenbacteria bacterium]|nr:hypothetical protein [Candidatus Eisenbacteria bacterium]